MITNLLGAWAAPVAKAADVADKLNTEARLGGFGLPGELSPVVAALTTTRSGSPAAVGNLSTSPAEPQPGAAALSSRIAGWWSVPAVRWAAYAFGVVAVLWLIRRGRG